MGQARMESTATTCTSRQFEALPTFILWHSTDYGTSLNRFSPLTCSLKLRLAYSKANKPGLSIREPATRSSTKQYGLSAFNESPFGPTKGFSYSFDSTIRGQRCQPVRYKLNGLVSVIDHRLSQSAHVRGSPSLAMQTFHYSVLTHLVRYGAPLPTYLTHTGPLAHGNLYL